MHRFSFLFLISCIAICVECSIFSRPIILLQYSNLWSKKTNVSPVKENYATSPTKNHVSLSQNSKTESKSFANSHLISDSDDDLDESMTLQQLVM